MSGAATYNAALAEILARASQSYRRRDDPTTCALLEEAIEAAPHRLDLRFCLASHRIQTERPELALEIFEHLASVAPRDVAALTLLAHWRRHAGDGAGAQAALLRLREIRPGRADDLARLWATVDTWLSRQVTDRLPEAPPGDQGRSAIVTLGYKLSAYGTPRRELLDRLEKTLEASRLFPDALIIVSGGVPRSGRVEAVEMRQWLCGRGVPPEQIYEEGYARDVVENLLYSRQILDALGVTSVLAITSAIDVRRTGAGLETLAWSHGSAWAATATAASGEGFDSFADDGRDRLKLYRDILRCYGMPMMVAYPELAER